MPEIGEIKRVVNTLLQSLDSRNGNGTGITVAATNHEHLLDSAVRRRFDSRIELQKPEAEAREHLLRSFLSPIMPQAAEMRFLVWATEGMSGADIEMLVDAGKRFLILHRPGQSRQNKGNLGVKHCTSLPFWRDCAIKLG